MRRFRFALAAISVLFMAAGQTARASVPLSALLVHRSDLKPGYRMAPGLGYMHTLQLPDGSPISSRILKAHGYLFTYAAQFTDLGRQPSAGRAAATVTESADVYRTAAGAQWGYGRMVHARYPQSFSTAMPRVGSASAAFTADLPEPPGKEIDIFFRERHYVVRVAVAATPIRKNSVLALARLIDKRINGNG